MWAEPEGAGDNFVFDTGRPRTGMAPQPHRDISLVNVLPQHAFAGDARLSGVSVGFGSFLGIMELYQPLDIFWENYFPSGRLGGAGRNWPFIEAITPSLYAGLRGSQALFVSTIRLPVLTIWCPFWCPLALPECGLRQRAFNSVNWSTARSTLTTTRSASSARPSQIEFNGRDHHGERLLVQEAFRVHRARKMLVPIIDDAHLMQPERLRKLRLLAAANGGRASRRAQEAGSHGALSQWLARRAATRKRRNSRRSLSRGSRWPSPKPTAGPMCTQISRCGSGSRAALTAPLTCAPCP